MPDSTVSKFTDAYEYQRTIRGGTADIIVTSAGRFEAELTRVDLHQLWMQRGKEILPRIAHVALREKRNFMLFLTGSQQSIISNRKELSPGEIALLPSGSDHYQRSESAVEWGAMSLTADQLAAAGRAIAADELVDRSWSGVIRPPPELMRQLLRLHKAAGQLAATAPEILAHHEVANAIEQSLIGTLVSCLVQGMGDKREPGGRTRVQVMRRFEQLLEANLDSTLYLPEVCAAIGVPARTLRHHCMEYLGVSPRHYLWLRRMNLARRSLAQSDPRSRTVSAIANDYGFAELGRFAVSYRKLFGEAPSATLQRPAEQPPKMPSESFSAFLPKLHMHA